MTEQEAWDALAGVVDPELGIGIVELGLAYGVELSPSRIGVTVTLPTPGWPLHDVLVSGVERGLSLPGGPAVDVDVVWDPPWTPERICADGRRALGGPRAGR